MAISFQSSFGNRTQDEAEANIRAETKPTYQSVFGKHHPETRFNWVRCDAFQAIYHQKTQHLDAYKEALTYAYSMLGESMVDDQSRLVERTNALREARNAFSNASRQTEDGDLEQALKALAELRLKLIAFYAICEHT